MEHRKYDLQIHKNRSSTTVRTTKPSVRLLILTTGSSDIYKEPDVSESMMLGASVPVAGYTCPYAISKTHAVNHKAVSKTLQRDG